MGLFKGPGQACADNAIPGQTENQFFFMFHERSSRKGGQRTTQYTAADVPGMDFPRSAAAKSSFEVMPRGRKALALRRGIYPAAGIMPAACVSRIGKNAAVFYPSGDSASGTLPAALPFSLSSFPPEKGGSNHKETFDEKIDAPDKGILKGYHIGGILFCKAWFSKLSGGAPRAPPPGRRAGPPRPPPPPPPGAPPRG